MKSLDEAQIPWEMAVESMSSMTVEASLSADLAVQARLQGTAPPYLEAVPQGALPELPEFQINMMTAPASRNEMAPLLAEIVREEYCCSMEPLRRMPVAV